MKLVDTYPGIEHEGVLLQLIKDGESAGSPQVALGNERIWQFCCLPQFGRKLGNSARALSPPMICRNIYATPYPPQGF
jgi:hypothetical protein